MLPESKSDNYLVNAICEELARRAAIDIQYFQL